MMVVMVEDNVTRFGGENVDKITISAIGSVTLFHTNGGLSIWFKEGLVSSTFHEKFIMESCSLDWNELIYNYTMTERKHGLFNRKKEYDHNQITLKSIVSTVETLVDLKVDWLEGIDIKPLELHHTVGWKDVITTDRMVYLLSKTGDKYQIRLM